MDVECTNASVSAAFLPHLYITRGGNSLIKESKFQERGTRRGSSDACYTITIHRFQCNSRPWTDSNPVSPTYVMKSKYDEPFSTNASVGTIWRLLQICYLVGQVFVNQLKERTDNNVQTDFTMPITLIHPFDALITTQVSYTGSKNRLVSLGLIAVLMVGWGVCEMEVKKSPSSTGTVLIPGQGNAQWGFRLESWRKQVAPRHSTQLQTEPNISIGMT